jgi:hypothetical protein
MSMSDATPETPQVGWSIYTHDGQELGQVREVRGSYFRINAPREPDYWLDMEWIASSADGRLTMSFDRADLVADVIMLRIPKTVR